MGDLEKRGKRRARITKIQKLILQSVSTAGVLSVALLAPNVLTAMHKIGILPKVRQREYISSSAANLRRKGLITYKGGHYELTSNGINLLKEWEFRNYVIVRPKKWDGKWRVIIFDIPEKKKMLREQIRLIFRQAGLEKLQNSVWIFPYDCEDVIGLLKTELGLGKNLLYLIVDELENDKNLRRIFHLL